MYKTMSSLSLGEVLQCKRESDQMRISTQWQLHKEWLCPKKDIAGLLFIPPWNCKDSLHSFQSYVGVF